MEVKIQKQEFVYDAFISYSRRNAEFAEAFYKRLSEYRPPKGLNLLQRRLSIFLDQRELYGNDLDEALKRNLLNSAKLVVLCSPESRSSGFVNQEIREFAEHNNARNIVPILISGKPNHEAQNEAEKAFPEALYEVLTTPKKKGNPLAIDYREFRVGKDKFGKDRYFDPWFASLASIYGIDRGDIEQREKRRQTRTRWITSAIVSLVIIALSVALTFAMISRSEARRQRNQAVQAQELAESTAYAANMNLASTEFERGNAPRGYALLDAYLPMTGVASTKDTAPTKENLRSFYWYYLWREKHNEKATLAGHKAYVSSVAFSNDTQMLASASGDETIKLWDVVSRQEITTLVGHKDFVELVAFSHDGRVLASASNDGTAKLW